ncbi:MAG: L-histidine N(alpha)-methyltransferase [Nitrosopumilaceae archaeon]
MEGDAWDDMSSQYDNCVEKNPDAVISGYIAEEMKITANLCKKMIKPDKKYTIIDMGSGTGRVLFSLYKILSDSVFYCGLDASEQMIQISNQKLLDLDIKNTTFLYYDTTNPSIDELFDDDSAKITMCMYNTVGVIPPSKRHQFFDNMKRLAGKEGLALVSAFNGDDFAFAAPKMYHPMKEMVKKIDEDSFDEKRLAFRNSLGYYSQWFTKNQLNNFLDSKTEPIPINVSINNKSHTLGHVFTDRQV